MAATHRMGTMTGTILNRNVVRTMIVNRSMPIMVVGLRLKTSLTMVWVTMAATHRMGTMTGTILNRNVVRTMIVNRSMPIMEEEVEVMTMTGTILNRNVVRTMIVNR